MKDFDNSFNSVTDIVNKGIKFSKVIIATTFCLSIGVIGFLIWLIFKICQRFDLI